MCGIACVAGNKNSLKYCYEALEKLEYRGYDSAGIACLYNDEILVEKSERLIQNLKEFSISKDSNLAISHTRWATHGKVCEKNTHPHISYNKQVAIVHNGIVENYQEIKKDLELKGVVFKSETDSECVCHLLAIKDDDILNNVLSLKDEIRGNYAFAIIDKKLKTMYGTKNGNSLYVAKTEKGTMLVSDLMCLTELAENYYALNDYEVVQISELGDIILYNEYGEKINIEYVPLNLTENKLDKMGFDYYMEKEINEIPIVIKNIIMKYKNGGLLKKINLLDIKEVKIIGCGTAYHASIYGAKVLEKYLKIPCHAYIASEFKYSNPIIDEQTLVIFVSQSGETMDTIGCVDIVRKKKAKTIAITNVEHSHLAQITDINLPVVAGREIAIASTKAYVAQILVFYILARYLADDKYDFEDLIDLPNYAKGTINIDNKIVNLIKNQSKVFFLGRGIDSVTSLEASLKLKETTYKSSEGYPAGELKHGPIALIEEDTPVVIFSTEEDMFEKVLNAAQEVKSRGAKIILVTSEDVDKKYYDYKINMPVNLNPELCALLTIIPFQLLAYKTCITLGYNPDKPRNLSKSVTVE